MLQPPNYSMLSTCSDNQHWVLYCRSMDDRSYVPDFSWSSPLPIVVMLLGRTPASTSWVSVTRNKCHNHLAHVSKSTLIMCSAISLALANSRTGSCIVVLSLQTLPLCSDTERNWYCRMELGWLARTYFTACTTCDSVLSLICGHKDIGSAAMHATSMRAITVIWCSFIPYHMLLLDQTFQ